MSIRNMALGLAIALFALVIGHPTDAAAQATRTWVSGVGDDANPCSRTAPCKTFAGAISKTAENGIIDVLDPGGFGTLTIVKSITIRGTNGLASILSSSTTGVNINAPGKTVHLVGLQIDGAATGLIGVNIISAANVFISDCRIVGFKGGAGTGIKSAGAATTRLALHDSVISDNLVGLDVAPPGAGVNGVLVEDTLFDNNLTASIRGNSSAALIILHRSSVRVGVLLTNGAVLQSYGDNALPTGLTPTNTFPLR